MWVQVEGNWFRSSANVWIECRDRGVSIKRRDISDLVSKAKDVFLSCRQRRQDSYFDKLMFVSTSSYDSDAIALANQEGVGCFLNSGGRYLPQNDWNQDDKPKRLADVQATR